MITFRIDGNILVQPLFQHTYGVVHVAPQLNGRKLTYKDRDLMEWFLYKGLPPAPASASDMEHTQQLGRIAKHHREVTSFVEKNFSAIMSFHDPTWHN